MWRAGSAVQWHSSRTDQRLLVRTYCLGSISGNGLYNHPCYSTYYTSFLNQWFNHPITSTCITPCFRYQSHEPHILLKLFKKRKWIVLNILYKKIYLSYSQFNTIFHQMFFKKQYMTNLDLYPMNDSGQSVWMITCHQGQTIITECKITRTIL